MSHLTPFGKACIFIDEHEGECKTSGEFTVGLFAFLVIYITILMTINQVIELIKYIW